MLSRLVNFDQTRAQRAANGLGVRENIAPAPTAAMEMNPSPALSILATFGFGKFLSLGKRPPKVKGILRTGRAKLRV